jgi:hypothetical protein
VAIETHWKPASETRFITSTHVHSVSEKPCTNNTSLRRPIEPQHTSAQPQRSAACLFFLLLGKTNLSRPPVIGL